MKKLDLSALDVSSFEMDPFATPDYQKERPTTNDPTARTNCFVCPVETQLGC